MPQMIFARATFAPKPVQKRGMSAALRRLAARRMVKAFAVSTLFIAAHSANAATYNYSGGGSVTAPGTGNWSLAGNWNPSGVPVSASTTTLTFGGAGVASYASTDDITGAFVLNILTFASTSQATEVLAGNALNFTSNGSATPIINQNGAGAFNITNALTLTNILAINGSGTGTVILSGNITGAVSLADNDQADRVILGGNNSAWTGGLSLAGNSGLGTGAVVQITSSTALGTGLVTIGSAGNGETSRLEFNLTGTNTISNAFSISSRTVGNNSPDIENIAGNTSLTGAYAQGVGGSPVNFQSDSGLLTLAFASGAARNTTLEGIGNGLINVTNFIDPTAANLRILTKIGSGTWTLGKTQGYTGGTAIIGGTLALDFNAAVLTNNLLLSTGALTLGNGTLQILANNSGATTQTLGNLTLNTNSGNTITLTPGTGTSTGLTLGNTFTRGVGSTLNFNLTSKGTLTAVPTAATNGILGYATVNDGTSTGLAQLSSGKLVRLTGQTTLAASSSSATTNFTTSGSLTMNPASFAVNSLTIDTSGGNGTLDLGGSSDILTLTSGGLLMTGANNETIQNGQVGAAGSEVIAHQFGTGTLTIAGPVSSGTGSLTKDGSGTLVLSGTNAYTGITEVNTGALTLSGSNTLGGSIVVSAGTLNVAPGGTLTAGTGAVLLIGNQSNSRSVLNINGGTVTAGKTTSPSLDVATVAGALGDVRMSAGTLTTTSEIHLGESVGLDEGGAYAAFTQTGGTVTAGSYFVIGFNNDNAVFNQSGGTFTVSTNVMTIGAGGTLSNGVANLTGGTFASAGGLFVGEVGNGTLDVSGTSSLSLGTNGLKLSSTGTGSNGTVNLLTGGTITTNKVVNGAGTGNFNFNGGTLIAGNTPVGATFMTGLTNATIYSGGANINDGGNAITIGQSLLAPVGSGVSTITTSGGTGYLDTPVVTISGGGGSGATGVATIDGSGNLTGVTITNPGSGYTSSPTVSFSGGGGTGASVTGSTIAANTSGGLTKSGSGTLTLTGASTYNGATNISAGALSLSGTTASLGNTAISIASGATFSPLVASGANSVGTSGGAGTASLSVSSGGAFTMVNNSIGTFNLNGTTGSTALTVGSTTGVAPVFSFDIFNTGTTTTTDLLNITGNVSFAASGGTIALNAATGTTTLTTGNYVLISAGGGLVTGVGGFNLSNSVFHVGSTNYSVSLGSSTSTQEILSVSPLVVSSIYWTGSQSSIWNTVNGSLTNFSTNLAGTTNSSSLPNISSDVVFTATNANTTNLLTTLGQDFTVNSIVFLGSGPTATTSYTISGTNTLTLNAGINQQAGSAAQTVSTNVALGTSQTWTSNSTNGLLVSGNVSAAGNNLSLAGVGAMTVSGVISGTGTAVTDLASGSVTFSNTNTYTGGTTLNAGSLTGTVIGSFGNGNVTVNPTGSTSTAVDNATLSANGSIASTAAVTVNSEAADGGFGVGTVIFNSTAPLIGSLIGSGSVVLNNTTGTSLTTGGANTSTAFSGVISDGAGSGSLTKSGTGTFTLSGVNTYSGATTLSAGDLTTVTLANGGTASSIGQSSNAASNLVLNGGTLSYTGAAVSTDRLFTLSGSISLDASGTGALSFTNTGAIVQGGASARTLTLTGSNTGANSLAATLGDSGTGVNITSLVKSGAGTWALSGSNTYSGGTTLSAGTLNINNSSAIGTGTFTIAGGVIDNTSGAGLTLMTNNTQAWNGDFAYAESNPLNLGTGPITLSGNRFVNLTGSNANVLTAGGNISGAFSLSIGGSGAMTLTGNNTYTGGTTINAGGASSTVVRADSDTAFGTGLISLATIGNGTTSRLEIVNGRNIANTINFGARSPGNNTPGIESVSGNNTLSGTIGLTTGGSVYIVQSDAGLLTFSGASTSASGVAVQALSGSRSLTFQGASNGLVSGIVQNGSGTIALTKAGTGAWTLSGANTYTGGTTVNSGTLNINNMTAIGTGTLTLIGGAIDNTSGALVTMSNNNTQSWNGDFTFTGTNALALGTGAVTLGGNRTITLNGTTSNALTVGGAISGAYSLSINGTGALVLTGTNTYSGGTTISGGLLQVGAAGTTGSLGTGAVTDNSALAFNQIGSTTVANAIGGTGTLAQNGIGTVTLSGTNTYTGGTTISAGTLSGTTASFSTGAIVDNSTLDVTQSVSGTLANTVSGSGNLTVGNAASTSSNTVVSITGANTLSGTTTVNGGTLSGATVNYSAGAVTVNSGATADYTQSADSTYTPNIGGAGFVTIHAPGHVINYAGVDSAGGTTIASGTLNLSHTGGSGLSGPVAVATGGLLAFASDNEVTTSGNVTLSGGTLAANGHSDGTATTSGLGTLTLSDSSPSGTASTIDFGDVTIGGVQTPALNTLAFSDSAGITWTGSVQIVNYTDGSDMFYIGQTNDLSTDQLSRITFNGLSASQLPTGQITFVVPAPEPGGWVSMLLGTSALGGLVARRRRIAAAV